MDDPLLRSFSGDECAALSMNASIKPGLTTIEHCSE